MGNFKITWKSFKGELKLGFFFSWIITINSFFCFLEKYYMSIHSYFFYDFISLFLDREEGSEEEKERNMCGCLWHSPYWAPGLQPRHVPWLGIKLATPWFVGQCSIHWDTPARAEYTFFILKTKMLMRI